MVTKTKLMKCVHCGKTIQSMSPVRKYCFDCRQKMRLVWLDNFKKKKKGSK